MANETTTIHNNDALFLSIIIPVYNNSEQDLRRCINCLTFQDVLFDYEIIIIDDGSEHACSIFLDQLAFEKEKVSVIHQKNMGPAAARNNGLAIAKGKYILFVDGDDIIPRQFWYDVSFVYKHKCDYDVIYGLVLPGVYASRESGAITTSDIKIEDVKEKNVLYRHLIDLQEPAFKYPQGYISRGPIARLIKKDVALKCPFDGTLLHGEDHIWNLDVVIAAKEIGVIPHCWYYYIKNPVSITHKSNPHYIKWRQKYLGVLLQYIKSPDLYTSYENQIIEAMHEIADICFLPNINWHNFFKKNSEFNKLKQEYPFNLIKLSYITGGKKSFLKYIMYKTNIMLLVFWIKAKIINQ